MRNHRKISAPQTGIVYENPNDMYDKQTQELFEERLGLPGGDVDLTEEEILELIEEGYL